MKVAIKSKVVTLKLTPEQFRVLEQSAQRCGVRLGPWMRAVLVQVAEQKPKKGFIRIRELDGAST